MVLRQKTSSEPDPGAGPGLEGSVAPDVCQPSLASGGLCQVGRLDQEFRGHGVRASVIGVSD